MTRKKIAIFSPPFSGHLYPLLELVRALDPKVYSISVYTGEKKKALIESLGFQYCSLLEEENNIFEKIANTPMKTNLRLLYAQLRQNIKLSLVLKKRIQSVWKEEKPDLVIADFTVLPIALLYEEEAFPWITTMPTPFALENKQGPPSYLGAWEEKDGFCYQIRDFLARKIVRLSKSLLYTLARRGIPGLPKSLYRENGDELLYSPLSILGIGMQELEFRKDFPKHFLFLGPCFPSFESSEAFVFHPLQKKIIFLTSGTHLLWVKKFFRELARQLGKKYPQFCFLLTEGQQELEMKQEKLAENVFVYSYIPYASILEKVDYVIHHGGAGILYACIKYQKPALILAQDYDQFDYALRAKLANIAILPKRKNLQAILDAVEELLERKDWSDLERLSKVYHNYDSLANFQTVIEHFLEEESH